MARSKPAGPRLDLRRGTVDLTHGAGGKASAQLFDEIFRPAFDNPTLDCADDQAGFAGSGRMVTATDAHVVSPLFFPGGDIGCLAVHGTINDVAMGGAVPKVLTAAFILEEGFPLSDLKRIADSMGQAAKAAGVPIIAGDTKVVERGKGDGVFITTTGIGAIDDTVANPPAAHRLQVGDALLLSGPVGAHGVTILAARNDLPFSAPIESDTAPLHSLVAALMAEVDDVHCLRDPTRGGLATAIVELCLSAGVGAILQEGAIPIARPVAAACEVLGVDPLYLANEGKLIAAVPGGRAEAALAAMRRHPLGAEAALIGRVTDAAPGDVRLETAMGGFRQVDRLAGDPLPRIC